MLAELWKQTEYYKNETLIYHIKRSYLRQDWTIIITQDLAKAE
jgi:hypothetical protein